jgi:hypothetical protein
VQVGADLAQTHGQIAQLLSRRSELRSEALEWRERALGKRGQGGSALPLVGHDGGRG